MGRLLSEYEAAEAIVMVRASVAFLFLAGLAYANRELKLPYSNKVVGHFILLGIFGFAGHNFLLFKALEHAQANTGAVINVAIPIAVILLDLVIFRKRISRISLVGVGLSFFGTAMVITGGHIVGLFSGTVGYGEILCLIAVVCWAAYTVTARPLLEHFPVIAVTAYSCLAGSVLLCFPMLLNWETNVRLFYEPIILLLVAVQGILTMGFGILWFYQGVRELGALSASVYINLVPLFGVVLSLVLVGEIPDLTLVVGGLMVVGSLLMINYFQQACAS